MNINLSDFITDDVNIIEFFLCKDIIDDDVINVIINNDIENLIEKKYKKYKEENYKSYHYNGQLCKEINYINGKKV